MRRERLRPTCEGHITNVLQGTAPLSSQGGLAMHPGVNVGLGRDFTLYATAAGYVKFESRRGRNLVSVYPASEE